MLRYSSRFQESTRMSPICPTGLSTRRISSIPFCLSARCFIFCSTFLLRTTSNVESGNGRALMSPSLTSTFSATPSNSALARVTSALFPDSAYLCHMSTPTALPVSSLFAAPTRSRPGPHPTSRTSRTALQSIRSSKRSL